MTGIYSISNASIRRQVNFRAEQTNPNAGTNTVKSNDDGGSNTKKYVIGGGLLALAVLAAVFHKNIGKFLGIIEREAPKAEEKVDPKKVVNSKTRTKKHTKNNGAKSKPAAKKTVKHAPAAKSAPAPAQDLKTPAKARTKVGRVLQRVKDAAGFENWEIPGFLRGGSKPANVTPPKHKVAPPSSAKKAQASAAKPALAPAAKPAPAPESATVSAPKPAAVPAPKAPITEPKPAVAPAPESAAVSAAKPAPAPAVTSEPAPAPVSDLRRPKSLEEVWPIQPAAEASDQAPALVAKSVMPGPKPAPAPAPHPGAKPSDVEILGPDELPSNPGGPTSFEPLAEPAGPEPTPAPAVGPVVVPVTVPLAPAANEAIKPAIVSASAKNPIASSGAKKSPLRRLWDSTGGRIFKKPEELKAVPTAVLQAKSKTPELGLTSLTTQLLNSTVAQISHNATIERSLARKTMEPVSVLDTIIARVQSWLPEKRVKAPKAQKAVPTAVLQDKSKTPELGLTGLTTQLLNSTVTLTSHNAAIERSLARKTMEPVSVLDTIIARVQSWLPEKRVKTPKTAEQALSASKILSPDGSAAEKPIQSTSEARTGWGQKIRQGLEQHRDQKQVRTLRKSLPYLKLEGKSLPELGAELGVPEGLKIKGIKQKDGYATLEIVDPKTQKHEYDIVFRQFKNRDQKIVASKDIYKIGQDGEDVNQVTYTDHNDGLGFIKVREKTPDSLTQYDRKTGNAMSHSITKDGITTTKKYGFDINNDHVLRQIVRDDNNGNVEVVEYFNGHADVKRSYTDKVLTSKVYDNYSGKFTQHFDSLSGRLTKQENADGSYGIPTNFNEDNKAVKMEWHFNDGTSTTEAVTDPGYTYIQPPKKKIVDFSEF